MNGTTNASPRVKRKPEPYSDFDERPAKLHRSSLNGKQSAGDNTPDVVEQDFDMHHGHDYMEDDAAASTIQALMAAGPDTAEWQATIESVVRNVVSIRF
jgi:hypothetical protein